MLPHAEEAWSRPGPSPTSHPWGGPSSNAGAWGLLRQEKSRRERGRGQARSEQGHRPLSPAPEEGAPGTGASQVARGCEPDPLHSAPRTGKQAGQHLCPLHPAETWSAPGHTVRGGQTQGGPGRLPVPRGGTDKGVSRYGGASAVHERKHSPRSALLPPIFLVNVNPLLHLASCICSDGRQGAKGATHMMSRSPQSGPEPR